MKKFILSLSLVVLTSSLAATESANADYRNWGPHAGKMDTDGILSPGELRNPRINYNRPSYTYQKYPQTFGASSYTTYNRPGYYYRDDYYRYRNDKDCHNDRYRDDYYRDRYYNSRPWWQRW